MTQALGSIQLARSRCNTKGPHEIAAHANKSAVHRCIQLKITIVQEQPDAWNDNERAGNLRQAAKSRANAKLRVFTPATRPFTMSRRS